MEEWLLLFPAALEGCAFSLKVPSSLRERDTGLTANPKGAMKHGVSSSSRRDEESNSTDIIEQVVQMVWPMHPSESNASWTEFCSDSGALCDVAR